MFIRRIKSRKSTCFQIGEKRSGRFKLIKHVGCALTLPEIEALKIKAKQEFEKLILESQYSLFPQINKSIKAKLLLWQITGYHLTFGKVYDSIGLPNNLLRDLVITRIVYPRSKAATVRYLSRHLGITVGRDNVYRFLDTLDKNKLTRIAFDYVTKKNNGIFLFFYDVTTLYFETEKEDEFKKKGFSKDHRNDMPQILIGLIVDREGYPFDFDFFEGNTFEGHTFQTAIGNLIKKYQLDNLTIVADAAMLSEDNINWLNSRHLNYIVGARLKNMTEEVTLEITANDFKKKPIFEITLKATRLIVEYTKERAKKDAKEREKAVEKLKRQLKAGKPVIRKNKYLRLKNQSEVAGIDEDKIQQDQKFDGLKGYIVNQENNSLPSEIISQYHNLWQVEKAFRMSKGDLKERPIFHQNITRIKSHLLLCFVSLLVMKESEHILKKKGYTIEKAVEILGRVGQGEIRIGNIKVETDSEIDSETQTIIKLFEGH